MGQPESPSPVVRGRTFSPVVDKTWKKKESWKNARKSVKFAFLNLAAAFLLYFDMTFSVIRSFFNLDKPLYWYIELTLLGICMVNLMMDLGIHFTAYFFSSPVPVSLHQKRLLGIKETDPGFCDTPVKAPSPDNSLVFSSSPTSGAQSPSYSPSQGPSYSPSQSPWSSFGHATPTYQGSFNRSNTYITPTGSNASPGYFDRSGTPTASYLHNMSRDTSLPYSPGDTMASLDGSGLRSKLSMSMSYASTPSPAGGQMTDMKSLRQYLKDYEEKEYKASLNSSDLSASGSPSFWSYGRPSLDYSHVLRKNQYQLASRSPQSFKSRTDDNDNLGDEVWGPLGITDDDLYLWFERLRKWMGNTILVRLAAEVENVNAGLRKIGCEDTEIGEVSVSTLKQLALTKGSYVPSLNVLMPYLDFTSNQEYLVKRIKDLGKDSCISEYAWSQGGNYGKVWGEHLPTDASMVLHMLCTYLDSRLPPEIKYPDGKTFTSQYVMKTPDKPNLEKSDNLLIYQSAINPPHFQVVVKNTVYNLPKGRNNLFHAILFFLYQIKVHHNGMIGRVNLGMSGINIMGILDV